MARRKTKPFDKTINSFTVYEWHRGNEFIGEAMTVEEILNLDYKYVSFDREKGRVYVTNCCHFKMH